MKPQTNQSTKTNHQQKNEHHHRPIVAHANATTSPLPVPTTPLSIGVLPIQPGIGFGPFKLGSTIGTVIEFIQHHAMQLRENELICSTHQPSHNDLTLDLKDIGVRLRFDSTSQRLTLIDIYDHMKVPITYMRSLVVQRSGVPATFQHLSNIFGPTFPGVYDSEEKLYMLQYPGVCMCFHLPSFPSDDAAAQKGEREGEIVTSITMPDGSSPPLTRIFIHAGSEVREHLAALPAIASNDPYFEPILVHLNRGLHFTRRNVFISLESSFAQDLITELGAPQNMYVKREGCDKMNIHRGTGSTVGSQASSQHTSPSIPSRSLAGAGNVNATLQTPATQDYFYNYFLLGFDVLLDGVTHRVKKFILHTNFVDRPDFNQYARCNFAIVKTSSSGSASVQSGLSLLELPPTAVSSHAIGRSMLHPSGSLDSLLGTSPPSSSHSQTQPSHQQDPTDITLHTGVEDLSLDSHSSATTVGGKKKKKKSSASTSPAVTAVDPSTVVTAKASLPPRPNSAVSSVIQQSFSPSLSPSVLPQSHATQIGPESKWSDVLAVLGPCPSRPMVSASSATTGASTSSASIGSLASVSQPNHHSLENPFQATYFYAYQGAVFEVCKNHHLASVTLFRED